MSNETPDTETADTPQDATSQSNTDVSPMTDGSDDPTAESGPATEERSIEAVLAQVEVLQEENRRLRADYVRARQTAYRRTALALLGFSVLAGGGGLLFPGERATLFGLAGIGCVLAILLYHLTPQQVATATVGERSYATLARLGDAISADLGLQATRVYVPMAAAGEHTLQARLFIPLHTEYTLPEPDDLESVFVVQTAKQTRGIAVPPTGALLLRECQHTMIDALAQTPEALGEQLTETIVAGFELAEAAVADVDADAGQATIGIKESTFGAVDRFDHPLPSFVAVGLAVGLGTPVERAALTTDAGEFDATVTFTWDATAATDEEIVAPDSETTDTEDASMPA